MFSRAAGRKGHCRQMSLACAGSTRRVPATLGFPRPGVCALPIYTAQAPGCSIGSGPCGACGPSFRVFHRSADSVGPASSAFPHRSSSGSQEHDGCTHPGCSAPYPLRSPSLSFHAPVGCVRLVSVLVGRPLAETLPADVDHPKPQEVFG